VLAKKPANHDARVAAMADVTWPTALDQFHQRRQNSLQAVCAGMPRFGCALTRHRRHH
jgi:hypothetical protein